MASILLSESSLKVHLTEKKSVGTRVMGPAKRLVALAVVMGVLFMLPAPAKAVLVTIDEIIFQHDGVNSSVLAGTADFSVSGSTLTIVLRNTSTDVTGGLAGTNLLVGIGFNLPSGVTIANNAATNSVAITGGLPPSSPINFTAPISDTQWGAGNGALPAINNITVLGDVNASASTLLSQVQFDLAGNNVPPPATIDGPSFGLLSASVPSSTAGGLAAVQDSVTLTLALSAAPTDNAAFIAGINSSHVVLSFGSPTAPVPEPSSLLLMGVGLVSVGLVVRKKRFF